jgi:hypothetical protein
VRAGVVLTHCKTKHILLLGALLLAGCSTTHTSQSGKQVGPEQFRNFIFHPALPTPTPRCRIYDKTYPVTEGAFESQHVTALERKQIVKWAATDSPAQERLVRSVSPFTRPPSASEVHLVRWMLEPFKPGSVLVFCCAADRETRRLLFPVDSPQRKRSHRHSAVLDSRVSDSVGFIGGR